MKRPAADLLAELRAAEEHARLEAKQGFGKSALETVSAFCNEPDLDGGYLIFGIGENTTAPGGYEVTGVKSPSQLGETITSECSAKFNVPVRPQIWREELEGACVVVAYVAEAPDHEKPIFIQNRGLENGCYRRNGSADVKCRAEDLSVIYARRHGTNAEQLVVRESELSEIDSRALESYRRRLLELRPGSEAANLPDRELLVSLSAISSEGIPTRAGLVLFGSGPALRRHLPAVRIDLVQVAGTVWVDSAEEPFVEQLEIRQDAVGAFRRAQDWLASTLPKTSHFVPNDPVRKDDTTVPGRVLREALVNAIIHRDYAVQEAILVVRYRDRIEIRSPGYSLISREELGEAGSRTRNPAIAEVFRDLNLAETKGTGIRVMRQRMLVAERKAPEFRSDLKANRFTTVLSLEHLLSNEDRAWLDEVASGQDLHSRQALLCAKYEGRVTNAELRDLTGLDTLAASEVLKRLRDAGMLAQDTDGGKVGTYYELPPWLLLPRITRDTPEALPRTGSSESRQNAGGFEPDAGGLEPDAGGFEPDVGGFEPAGLNRNSVEQEPALLASFSPETQRLVTTLGTKPRMPTLRRAIVALCAEQALTPAQLAALLGNRHVKNLVASHLSPMVAEGLLERTRPKPSDPNQAYRTVSASGDA